MKVRNWRDLSGNWWREIVYHSWTKLHDLQKEYEKRGWKTWLSDWDEFHSLYVLTIMHEK